jgi:hypothetical protein
MQLPNPPWYRRWSVILAGVIGMAAIAAVFGLRGLEQVASPNTTATSQPPPTVVGSTTTVTETSLQQPQTATTRQPNVLWTETGHDVGKSPGIRAPGVWRIEWSFDCSNFKRYGAGNFKITGDGAFERIDIQRVAVKASGSQTVRRGGFGHLFVDSVCDRWTVTVLRG